MNFLMCLLSPSSPNGEIRGATVTITPSSVWLTLSDAVFELTSSLNAYLNKYSEGGGSWKVYNLGTVNEVMEQMFNFEAFGRPVI